MSRPELVHLMLCFSVFLLLLGYVEALPYRVEQKRQAPASNGTQTVYTETLTNTTAGMVMEGCAITFTPITDANGNSQVMEVQTCSMSVLPSGASVPVPSVTPLPTPSVSSSFPIVTLSASNGSPDIASVSSATTIAVIPITSATSSSAPTSSANLSVVSSSAFVSVASSSSASSSASLAASPVAAAENSASSASAAPFAIPGKTLQVLPIGLGIFAGISVIALIVVAIVTYERTKYRKAFRRRKLAEAGASMGYGGMGTTA